jgi:threonylcarbamoyladenosine tRNA methylthiotransferase MtaB
MAQVITFGCKLNLYEGELIKKRAKEASLSEDIIILNTCSVTEEAEKEAIKKIRSLKRKNPNSNIVVTGCAAQVNSGAFATMPEVSFVFGNKEKLGKEAYDIINNKGSYTAGENISDSTRYEDKIFLEARKGLRVESEKIMVNDIMSISETAGHMNHERAIVTDFENHTRGFVQIQNGCNHRCTFCIIPFARGNSRSVPFGELTLEISKLVENGYKEIVLTGVDITDYGKDLPGDLTLGKMVKRLLKAVPNLERLRFSSIDVAEVDRDIYELVSNEPRFMPYFHISLQSGDDLILKRMKRRHTRVDVINFIKQVREIRPESAFGADIIAGFPTETEEQFNNSKNLISESEISFCHIFSFSPHMGTAASKMPQVEKNVIKKRTNILIHEGKSQLIKNMQSMVGSYYDILLETNGSGGFTGRCENFISGVLPFSSDVKQGQIVRAKATGLIGEKLQFEYKNVC